MGDAILVLDDVTVFGNKYIRTGTISASATYDSGTGDVIVGGWDAVMGFKVERVIISGVDVNYKALLATDLLVAYLAGTADSELNEASIDDLTASVSTFIAIGKLS